MPTVAVVPEIVQSNWAVDSSHCSHRFLFTFKNADFSASWESVKKSWHMRSLGRDLCTKSDTLWPNGPWPSKTPHIMTPFCKIMEKSSWFGLSGFRPFLHTDIIPRLRKVSYSASSKVKILFSKPFCIRVEG